jgi:hypothetical protein
MPATWSCPNCGRRVPAGIGECRCGTRRPSPDQVAVAARRHKLPRDVLALAILLCLVLLAGLVALFLPYRPFTGPALLGAIDQSPQSRATRTPARPASPGRR